MKTWAGVLHGDDVTGLLSRVQPTERTLPQTCFSQHACFSDSGTELAADLYDDIITVRVSPHALGHYITPVLLWQSEKSQRALWVLL